MMSRYLNLGACIHQDDGESIHLPWFGEFQCGGLHGKSGAYYVNDEEGIKRALGCWRFLLEIYCICCHWSRGHATQCIARQSEGRLDVRECHHVAPAPLAAHQQRFIAALSLSLLLCWVMIRAADMSQAALTSNPSPQSLRLQCMHISICACAAWACSHAQAEGVQGTQGRSKISSAIQQLCN